MKASFLKRSKKANVRQAIREARKAARPVFAPGEVELDFIGPDGSKYYLLNPVSIPGYTYSF